MGVYSKKKQQRFKRNFNFIQFSYWLQLGQTLVDKKYLRMDIPFQIFQG